jgi:hypothetical protein
MYLKECWAALQSKLMAGTSMPYGRVTVHRKYTQITCSQARKQHAADVLLSRLHPYWKYKASSSTVLGARATPTIAEQQPYCPWAVTMAGLHRGCTRTHQAGDVIQESQQQQTLIQSNCNAQSWHTCRCCRCLRNTERTHTLPSFKSIFSISSSDAAEHTCGSGERAAPATHCHSPASHGCRCCTGSAACYSCTTWLQLPSTGGCITA